MTGNFLTQEQAWALLDELESATRLLDFGVAELHRIGLANDYYHLPMQLLAQGLERFLKLTLALGHARDSGRLPERSVVRCHGHDLVSLTDALVEVVADIDGYTSRRPVREDLEFIRNDRDLQRLLSILADFGERDRYHRLDGFLDPSSLDDEKDPYRRWEALETEISRRSPEWFRAMSSTAGTDEVLRRTNAYLASLVDRFARAVARMWTLGALHQEALNHKPLLRPFLTLRDDELGLRRGSPQ